jgi:hypothetical protein
MIKKNTILRDFMLAGTKDGKIIVSNLDEPYGEGSGSVVSIGVSLKQESFQPDWKVHIPYENLDELIDALQEAKDKHGKKR